MSVAPCLATRTVGSPLAVVLVALILLGSNRRSIIRSITGLIPAELGQLSTLAFLSLAGNELSGEDISDVTDATPFDWPYVSWLSTSSGGFFLLTC